MHHTPCQYRASPSTTRVAAYAKSVPHTAANAPSAPGSAWHFSSSVVVSGTAEQTARVGAYATSVPGIAYDVRRKLPDHAVRSYHIRNGLVAA
eukprot:881905-Rhodomonas_salina.1